MIDAELIRPRGEYAAPLPAGSTEGRLVFERGTANDVIVAERDLAELYTARFDGAVPRIEVAGSTIRVRHIWARRNRGRFALNARLPWAIELRGGASRVRADLSAATLTELHVGGGASHLDLQLPAPTGRVPIRFAGGLSHVGILRPKGVPVRVTVAGGGARIAVDDQRFGAVAGPIELDGCDPDAPAGYDIQIAGGAHALTVAVY